MRGAERFLAVVAVLAVAGCSRANPPGQERAAVIEDVEERLEALPYVGSNPVPSAERDLVGLVHEDRARAQPGFQLLTETEKIRLLDGSGRDRMEITAEQVAARSVFSEAELAPGGFVDLIDTDNAVLRVDRRGRVVWRLDLPAHHDLTHQGGRILTLTRRLEHVPDGDGVLPLLVEFVAEISEDGTLLREIPLHPALARWLSESARQGARDFVARHGDPVLQGLAEAKQADGRSAFEDTHLDVYHANFVQVAGREVEGVCRPGDLLLSIRHLDLVLFLRPEDSSVVWFWGPGELEWQHNPRLLPDGNLLIFDNGVRREWTRVLELDPRARRIVWEYGGGPGESFYSPSCGSADKLEGGNVVITDYAGGRVFEVTLDKQVVWDYRNRLTDASRHRVSIMRSHRVAPQLALDLLAE